MSGKQKASNGDHGAGVYGDSTISKPDSSQIGVRTLNAGIAAVAPPEIETRHSGSSDNPSDFDSNRRSGDGPYIEPTSANLAGIRRPTRRRFSRAYSGDSGDSGPRSEQVSAGRDRPRGSAPASDSRLMSVPAADNFNDRSRQSMRDMRAATSRHMPRCMKQAPPKPVLHPR